MVIYHWLQSLFSNLRGEAKMNRSSISCPRYFRAIFFWLWRSLSGCSNLYTLSFWLVNLRSMLLARFFFFSSLVVQVLKGCSKIMHDMWLSVCIVVVSSLFLWSPSGYICAFLLEFYGLLYVTLSSIFLFARPSC